MKKISMIVKKIIRSILPALAIIGLAFALMRIQLLLQDKWVSTSNSYARVKQFYKEDVPEVVFLGSSHTHYNINTLSMFKEYGFTSFDFSSPDQDFSATLFYAEEALRRDVKPDVIVIDVLNIVKFVQREERYRQCLDPIPFSIRKIQYINYIFDRNKRYNLDLQLDSRTSYLLSILRYHDRWRDIKQYDYDEDPLMAYYHGATHYHGYGPHYATVKADFSHYLDETELDQNALAENKKILKSIIEMCEKNGVQLLLIKTPTPNWSRQKHNIVSAWANEYGVTFIDYDEVLGQIGIDIESDFMDSTNHLNDKGATKFSLVLGDYLRQEYGLEDHRNEQKYCQWYADYDVYQADKKQYILNKETEIANYIDLIGDSDYEVYISCKDNLGGELHPELISLFAKLGLTDELILKSQWSYMAIIDGGNVVFQNLSKEAISWSGTISNKQIEMESRNYNKGNAASIMIDYEQYFVNKRGLGIVVYDKTLNDIIDSVTFDIHGGGTAYR